MPKPNLRPDHNGTQRSQFASHKKKIHAAQKICGICGQEVDFSLKFPHPRSPFHSFRHELGHELQEELRLNDPLWATKVAEIEEIRKSLLNSLTNLGSSAKIELMKNRLSVYAFKDTGEFISECVAEYANSPKKARSTAKSVVEILLRKGN